MNEQYNNVLWLSGTAGSCDAVMRLVVPLSASCGRCGIGLVRYSVLRNSCANSADSVALVGWDSQSFRRHSPNSRHSPAAAHHSVSSTTALLLRLCLQLSAAAVQRISTARFRSLSPMYSAPLRTQPTCYHTQRTLFSQPPTVDLTRSLTSPARRPAPPPPFVPRARPMKPR